MLKVESSGHYHQVVVTIDDVRRFLLTEAFQVPEDASCYVVKDDDTASRFVSWSEEARDLVFIWTD